MSCMICGKDGKFKVSILGKGGVPYGVCATCVGKARSALTYCERLAEAAHGAHNHELMKMDIMIQRRSYASLPEKSKVVYREIAKAVMDAFGPLPVESPEGRDDAGFETESIE